MNASEIMNELRRQSWTQKGQITMPFEFDHGSLEDQLWEEQGFYHSKGNGVLVSMREMPEYHAECYEFECVEILDGEVRYWKMKDMESIHVDPAHYEMMLEKRAEGKIDFPIYFTDEKYGYRFGVEESPECENGLRFLYQDLDTKTGIWTTHNFEHHISVEMWLKMNKAAETFFPYCESEEEAPGDEYTSVSFQIFEHDSSYCFLVHEHSDCEGCLEICHQEFDAQTKTYVVKGDGIGSFNKKEWKAFAALVDKFIQEVF